MEHCCLKRGHRRGLLAIGLHYFGVKLVADGHRSFPPGAPELISVLPPCHEIGERSLREITPIQELRDVETVAIRFRSGVRGISWA
jgi:hypothetical protein